MSDREESQRRPTRAELLAQQLDHDERTFSVRPDVVLDMDAGSADWQHDPRFWLRPEEGGFPPAHPEGAPAPTDEGSA